MAAVKIALINTNKPTTLRKVALERQKDRKIKPEIKDEINTGIQIISPNIGEDLIQSWTEIVTNSIQTRLRYRTRGAKQKWMTDAHHL